MCYHGDYGMSCDHVILTPLVHDIVKKYTADYDKTLIFNKVHHELNQVWLTLALIALCKDLLFCLVL